MSAYITQNDIQLWRGLNRDDLIKEYNEPLNIWAGDQMVTADGKTLSVCRFFEYNNQGGSCQIYEARPAVCRDFAPGVSRFCAGYAEKKLD